MGRSNHPSALFLLLLLLALPAVGQGTGAAATDRSAQVDAIFAPWSSREKPGCTVAVGEKGRTVLSRAYGMADLEHDVPNTPATIFEAGSVSKQFTAAAALLLVQQGKLSLRDDVRKYVPELPDYGTPITIDHLIHHTSGLRDWGGVAALAGWPRGTRIHTHAHMLDIASRQKSLNYEPGAEFSYTNTGYNLLVLIIERVSGQTFPEFTRQNLFAPLGMTQTQWRDDFTRIIKGRAIAYTEQEGAYHSEMPFENVFGNGGLLTTVGDLLLWNENFVHGKVGGNGLREEQLRRGRLNDGQEAGYAGGLFISTYQGVPEVYHDGATAGYRAFLGRYPEQGLSVAVLCNAGEVDPADLGHRTGDLFLAAPTKPEPPAPKGIVLTPEALAAKAGLYRHQRTGEPWRLTLIEGRLRTSGGRNLVPLSDSLFYAGSDGVQVAIDAGPNGRPTAVRILRPGGDITIYEPVRESTPRPEQLAEYAGEYTSDEADVTYRAVVEDGKLFLRARPDISFALTPAYADAFQDENGLLARFRRGADGKVSELSLGIARVRDLRLVRVGR
ncbi:MAG TPA: serine hydrolase domain-containing protein [Thermoanaerobaculia bacterium]|nr:serine hydrolase domain-containing protein [Thermoanaerobaculia bacterium]